MSGQVRWLDHGHWAEVVLSNPAKFNAMSRSMWRQLREVFEAVQAQTALRVVVVRGDGAHFCSGGDISEYPRFRFDEALLRDFHENEVWGGLSAILKVDVPVVADIRGNCMGAGVEIASCCDVRWAHVQARFGAPIAKLGFPMAPREAALVGAALGEMTAREMLLFAQVLDAPTLVQRGFLNACDEAPALDARCVDVVQGVLALSPQAVRLNKQTLRALRAGVRPDDWPQAYAYANSPEHREGIDAFVNKRTPQF
jgi:enoyl-CoA hydratase/carnithine racemase